MATQSTASHGRVGPDAVPLVLRVNGQDHALAIDPRATLLDALREQPRPDRHQEGLRPRRSAAPARSWSTAGGSTPA